MTVLHTRLRKTESWNLIKCRFSDTAGIAGLASHGIGIGALVYLRRVFEFLIEEAHQQALSDPAWREEDYARSRMDEKIALLRSWLPYFLLELKGLYAILSKGIHQLNEEECLQHFPVLKVAIELILDERLRQAEYQQKLDDAKKAIGKLTMELK